jgi:ATP-dependent DNA helicase PIF1
LKKEIQGIEINDQFQHALEIMENSGRNIFITGRAGTGKSTLLEYFRSFTRKKVAVLAPTGVAAVNVKGQTIHSFFKFKPDVTVDKIKRLKNEDKAAVYKKLDAIIIDEVSMVRADLLDCVDLFLRLNGPNKKSPFGGIQMIFVGDLYQLPPVLKGEERAIFSSVYDTPYFFSAHAFNNLKIEFVELEKVYRQHDEHFISLLIGIRNNSITEESLELLNQRFALEYDPDPDDFYVYLTTTNELAERINSRQLEKLGGDQFTFTGKIEGEFGKESMPTAISLQIKIGAQIMMLTNDTLKRWVNGTIGKIIGVLNENGSAPAIIVELANGEEVEITPYVWEIYRFFIDSNKLQSEAVGTFTQYPLTLAWAVTIHKSQGKTFNKVIIDIGRGTFAHGQMYVDLSRCTSLEGIILKQPIQKKHIWMDFKVVNFLTRFQYGKAEQNCSVENKVKKIQEAITRGETINIVYLKPNDEKSKRNIEPFEVGEMEFKGVTYLGVRAFCAKRHGERVFRVDRILEIEDNL